MTDPRIAPPSARQLLNQAVELHSRGDLAQAKALYQQLLEQQPQHPDALHLLGVIATQNQEHQLAVDLIGRAIALRPDQPAYHYNLAIALQGLDQLEAAVASYDRALALQPDYADAWHYRGTVLQKLRRWADCVASLDRFISYSPSNANAHFCKGDALRELGQLEAAVHSYKRALAIKPDYSQALVNLGVAYRGLRQFDAALASFERALQINPDFVEAHCNRGLALQDLRQSDAALKCFDKALEINPDFAEGYVNRGVTLMARKQLSDAIADFDRAIAIEPELAAAYENKAFTLLIGGQFANGWHAMEWRWKRNEARSRGLSTSKPLFKPNTTKKRLLVWAEQGVGDEIMFGSLLPEARRLCTKLLVKVDARLIPLFARSFENMEFFHRTAHVSEDAYDEHIPMGSLCQYLRPNEQSFKNASKVQLVADQARSSAIRETLGVRSGQKLCGISWRSKAEKSGADRSVSLASLAAALSLPHHRLVNLQYGDTKDEITQVGRQLGIDVLSCEDVDNFKDIDGLASLIQACDVVVSVSNVTVHLAGALGKDVRVLVPHMSNWRWMLDRSDSPWYASVRLYRQAAFDDWTGVFGQVRADLLG